MRDYTFTINNYTEEDITQVIALKDTAKYVVCGRETGDEGTAHLQGYVYFKSAIVFKSIKKMLPRAHIETAIADAKHNRTYCTKGNDILIEHGEMPVQGKRTDVEIVKNTLKEGGNMRAVIDMAKSVQTIRMAEIYLKYNEKGRDWKPEVVWYHGSTGSGKTKAAREWLGDDVYTPVSYKWWEGYDGHENVLLDDLRGSFCMYNEMLKLLDRYEFKVECKGGSRQLLAKKIAVTSCYHPRHIWNTVEDKEQLLRRIDKIVQLGSEVPVECESQIIF